MADIYDGNRSIDSLGRKVRSVSVFPWVVPAGVRAVWPDVTGTLAASDADGSNATIGIPMTGGVTLNFVPELVTSITTATKLFYTLLN